MELNGCELSNVPAPVFLRRKSRYVVGVDLGQSADPTAIAVIEHETGVIDEGSDYERHTGLRTKQKRAERLNVRHLERLPLGLSYPAQVQHVVELIARRPLCGDHRHNPADLIVDESGVGRAVGDIFLDAGLEPIRITITAGAEVTAHGERRWHVAKSVLISTLDALLHTGVLRFARELAEADAMKDELKDFRRKLSDVGRAIFAARSGAHDDLVLAVAIAAWWIARPQPAQAAWGVWGTTTARPEVTYGYGGGSNDTE